MKSAPFDYVVAKSVADAAAAMARDGISAALVAGGQSLLPMLSLRVAQPDVLIDIAGLDELKETCLTPAGLRIGALTTHADIEDGKLPDPFAGLLQKIASGISYRAIRNYGTIGGSVALADPAADWPVCLMALRADVRIAGRRGPRCQPIGDFVQGQFTTALDTAEIILGFDVPRPDPLMRWGSFKVVRKSGAFASSIAIVVERGRGGLVSVALGAAGPRPYLLPRIAERLGSGETSPEALRAAVAEDLQDHVPAADPYLHRLHTSTILHAVREMRSR